MPYIWEIITSIFITTNIYCESVCSKLGLTHVYLSWGHYEVRIYTIHTGIFNIKV